MIEPEVENTALEPVRLMRAVRNLRLPVEIVVVSEREAAEWRDVSARAAVRSSVASPSNPRAIPFTHNLTLLMQLCEDTGIELCRATGQCTVIRR